MARRFVTRISWVIVLIGMSAAVAHSRPVFGPVLQFVFDPYCDSRGLGGLSDDGRTVALTLWCRYGFSSPAQTLVLPEFLEHVPIDRETLEHIPMWTVGLSGDGYTAIGVVVPPGPDSGISQQAASYSQDSGLAALDFRVPPTPFGSTYSVAMSTSFDGSVIVGGAPLDEDGVVVPVVWSLDGTVRTLFPAEDYEGAVGEEGEYDHEGLATAVSSDGRTLGGEDGFGAFIWRADLGRLPIEGADLPSTAFSGPTALSSDGSIAVGQVRNGVAMQPYVWSRADGIELLPANIDPRVRPWVPTAIARDGEMIIGSGYVSQSTRRDGAMVWSRERGLERLRDHLEDLGALTWEWGRLDDAVDVSSDGAVLIGSGSRTGIYPSTEYFYARLAPRETGVGLCALGERGCIDFQVIARNQQLPKGGYGEPVYMESFEAPILNEAGDLVFAGTYIHAGLEREDCAPACGTYTVFVRRGTSRVEDLSLSVWPYRLPGRTDSQLIERRFGSLALSDSGDIFSEAVYSDRGAAYEALVRLPSDSSAPQIVALATREPDPEVDLVGRFANRLPTRHFELDSSSTPSFLASGTLAAVGTDAFGLAGFDTDGLLRWVFELDRPTVGLPEEILAADPIAFSAGGPGTFAVTAALAGPGTVSLVSSALWSVREGGEPVLIFRDGQYVPDTSEGWRFGPAGSHGSPWHPSVDDSGNVVFMNRLTRDTSPVELQSTIWRWKIEGKLERLLSDTGDFPGLPEGVRVRTLLEPWSNDSGDLLVPASILADDGTLVHGFAFWLRTPTGELVPLLRSGQAAPGLPDGVMLGDANWNENIFYDGFGYAALSAAGDAVLEYALVGGDVGEHNDRALYLVDRYGRADLLLREGDVLEVANGDPKIVAGFRVRYPAQSGHGRQIVNARREVALAVDFVDGGQAVVLLEAPQAKPPPKKRCREARRRWQVSMLRLPFRPWIDRTRSGPCEVEAKEFRERVRRDWDSKDRDAPRAARRERRRRAR